MKILHIAYSGLGGHGSVFFSMTDADHKNINQYEALFYGVEEIRETYIKKSEDRSIVWYFVKKKPGADIASYRAIVRIVKKSKPDILFLHGGCYIFPAWFAALFSSAPIKIVVRETVPNHLKTKLDWVGLAFSLIVAKKTVFLSTEYRDAIKKKFPFIFSDKRTTVIPNGIDLNIFKPAHKTEPGCIRIGMQSRLSVTKDHSTLIKAFKLLVNELPSTKNIRLCIAGDGDCRQELEKLARDLLISDKVVFTGMLEETALPGFINSLDIYVHATLGETMSTAIMQVMACRLPVIASDVLGVNNMIKHEENGLLVAPGNAEQLATALRFLLNNPAIQTSYADTAYKFAINNYSNTRMLASYQSVFEEG